MLKIEEPICNLQERVEAERQKGKEQMGKMERTLYCVETEEEPEEEVAEDLEIVSLYFTSEFWKILAYKEAFSTDFICMAPLVGITPFFTGTGPYYNHVIMVIFGLYYILVILFIRNLISWLILLFYLRNKYRRKMIKEVFTSLHVLMYSVMWSTIFLGVAIISQYIAVGDRNLKERFKYEIAKHVLQKNEIGIIPYLTNNLHSFTSIAFVYTLILISVFFILKTDQVKLKEENESLSSYRTTFKKKIVIIALAILVIIGKVQIEQMFYSSRSFFSVARPCYLPFGLIILFFGVTVFLQEIKKGTIVLPKRIVGSQNNAKDLSEILVNLFSSSIILGTAWFVIYDNITRSSYN